MRNNMNKSLEEENTRTYKLVDKAGFLAQDDINVGVVEFIGFDTNCEVNLFIGYLETRDTDSFGDLMIEGPTWVTAYELANYFEEVVHKQEKKKTFINKVLGYCGVYL